MTPSAPPPSAPPASATPSSAPSPALLARLEAIRADFMAGLPARLNTLEAQARDIVGSREPSPLILSRLIELTHTLAGAGGTFGLPELTSAARRLEERLRALVGGLGSSAPPPLASGTIDDLLADLRRAAALPALPPVPPPRPVDADGRALHAVYVYREPTDPPEAAATDDDDALARSLERGDYTPSVFTDADALAEACRRQPPGAILLENGPNGLAGDRLSRLRTEGRLATGLPIAQVGGRTDMAGRLAAVRAGAGAFFPPPLDIGKILEHLDRVTGRSSPDPLRVLIVEDDVVVADHYAAILESSGLLTRVESDPLRAEDAIQDFIPDMLLVNVAMPTCSGFELVAVLRQHESLAALPVVFITADTQAATLRAAIRSGVDGFLPKPVNLSDLVEVTRARARRGRLVKGLVARDSLTGTYNHAMIHELLATELARSRRDGTPLSVVMVDIDQFKAVNDGHGHAAGDLVIKGLARALSRDLRRTDLIGRYGGEEFTILMPATTAAQAAERIDALRRSFAATPFTHDMPDRRPPGADAPVSFTVTFSAGVCETPPPAREVSLAEEGRELLRRADDALYLAKHSGRNQVRVASDTDRAMQRRWC